MKNDKNMEIMNVDSQGNVISEAFPVSERAKKDHRKTSVGYTLIAVLLHILAFVPIIAATVVLAVKCYNLAPYYTFWPFVGVIIVGVFGLIFLAVSLIVTRKKSKSSIGGQTAKIAITYVCLTCVFALLLTYILPDVISNATQSTLFVEDLYYNGGSQAEKNAKLDRDFIMYNVLNGNLNDYNSATGDYSYTTLSKRQENQLGNWISYDNPEIQASFEEYKSVYGEKDIEGFQKNVLDVMKERLPLKYELYEFVYKTYVLNDYDYSFFNNLHRRLFTAAVVDYVYTYSDYERLIKEGFSNKKIKQLFDDNFDSFNHDGYQPFDDPLLLYAQMNGRMTVPVVLRLILNEGWTYSQGSYDANGNVYFTDEGNMLYELYDPAERDAFREANGAGCFKYEEERLNGDGTLIKDKYGINEKGWLVFESGVVKRPINWLVLDMLGDPMDVASVDIYSTLSSLLGGVIGGLVPGLGGSDLSPEMIKSLLSGILENLGGLFGAVGGLVKDDVGDLIADVTGGAKLTLSLCIDDNDQLNISITPMNATYGMLGYMQASWVQSNNLLMAVINVMGLRNWLCIFGAIGVVLVIAAGVCRECGKKTRMRTAVARDRMIRANTARKIADGELDPAELDKTVDLGAELTAADVVEIEKKQKRNKKQREQAESEDDMLAEQPVPVAADTLDAVEEEPVKEKKSLFGKKNKKKDEEPELENFDEPSADNLDAVEEEPVKEKKSLFGKKNKKKDEDLEFENFDEPSADNFDTVEEEPVKEKKSLFGKKNKKKDEEPEVEIFDEPSADTFDAVEEEPVKEKKSLFGKKNKKKDEESEFESFDEPSADNFDAVEEEPVKEKKGLFGKKNKKQKEETAEDTGAVDDDDFLF